MVHLEERSNKSALPISPAVLFALLWVWDHSLYFTLRNSWFISFPLTELFFLHALHYRKISKWAGAESPGSETHWAFCRAVNTHLLQQPVCKLQVPRRENPINKTWPFLSLGGRHHHEKQQRADVLSHKNKQYLDATLECDEDSK